MKRGALMNEEAFQSRDWLLLSSTNFTLFIFAFVYISDCASEGPSLPSESNGIYSGRKNVNIFGSKSMSH